MSTLLSWAWWWIRVGRKGVSLGSLAWKNIKVRIPRILININNIIHWLYFECAQGVWGLGFGVWGMRERFIHLAIQIFNYIAKCTCVQHQQKWIHKFNIAQVTFSNIMLHNKQLEQGEKYFAALWNFTTNWQKIAITKYGPLVSFEIASSVSLAIWNEWIQEWIFSYLLHTASMQPIGLLNSPEKGLRNYTPAKQSLTSGDPHVMEAFSLLMTHLTHSSLSHICWSCKRAFGNNFSLLSPTFHGIQFAKGKLLVASTLHAIKFC